MSFDEIFDLTAGVYFNFYNILKIVSPLLSTMIGISIFYFSGEFSSNLTTYIYFIDLCL